VIKGKSLTLSVAETVPLLYLTIKTIGYWFFAGIYDELGAPFLCVNMSVMRYFSAPSWC
jgi:hypothetical protein